MIVIRGSIISRKEDLINSGAQRVYSLFACPAWNFYNAPALYSLTFRWYYTYNITVHRLFYVILMETFTHPRHLTRVMSLLMLPRAIYLSRFIYYCNAARLAVRLALTTILVAYEKKLAIVEFIAFASCVCINETSEICGKRLLYRLRKSVTRQK